MSRFGRALDQSAMSSHLARRLESGNVVPGTRRVDGAVLLSDIVGFTAHVEAMAGIGRLGLEAFSVSMASYLDRVIRLVHSFGGDVLDIAGDSLLCLWESNGVEDGAREAVAAAAAAALAIQTAVRDHGLVPGRTIETRMGVSVGSLNLTVAGGVDGRWELLAEGPAVSQVDAAERRCRPGAVTVSSAVVAILGSNAATVPMAGDLFELTDLDVTDLDVTDLDVTDLDLAPPTSVGTPTVATPTVATVTSASATGERRWPMEFRRLSVAMVRVPELSGDSFALAHDIVERFQRIVADREGTSSVVIDNKGVRLLATFGAPPHAHEDDPARAVDSVRAFAADVEELGVSCAAGIATGRALYGLAGNEIRQAITLAGDVINVAARLSTSANRTVLCDQETAVGAQSRYAFTVMNPIMVKGKAAPIAVFEPSGKVEGRRRRSVIVRGRRGELDRLETLLDTPATDIVLIGDAGLGKSTLLDEIVSRASQRGHRVLVARADAIERTTPFLAWSGPIREILHRTFGTTGVDLVELVEFVRSRLSEPMAVHAAVLANLIGSLVGGVAVGERVDLPEEDRAQVLPRLVAEFLGPQTAGLVVFEDAHWADSASIAVLRVWLELADRPSMLIATRPDGRPVLGGIIGSATTIDLVPLDDDAVRQMISDRLATPRIPEDLMRFVHQRVAGHPYFCEQLLQSLVESGTITVVGEEVVVGDLDAASIPSTVEGVIVSRFDRLGAAEQRVLKAASVVGRRHTVAAVGTCLVETGRVDDGPTDVAAVLAGMSEDGLLVQVDDITFAFQHVTARDVVYNLMPDRQRREMHRLVAAHLEATGEMTSPALIGRHWRSAGDYEAAVGYLELAAVDALGAGSFSETLALLAEARELRDEHGIQPDHERRANLALQHSRAAYYLGLFAESRVELESVIALLDSPMPATDEAHRAEHQAAERAREQRRRNRASSADDDRGPEAVGKVLFDTYRFLVKVLYLVGETGLPIVTASLRGLALADRLGRDLEGAAMQALVSGAYSVIGDVERFEMHSAEAIAVAESPRGAAVANHVWRMIAVGRAGLGQWAGSLDASDRALAALDPEGQNRDAGIWQTRAAVHLCAGDFARADEAWGRTATIAARDHNMQLARWSRLDEVQTLVGRGLIDEADRALTSTIVDLGPPSEPLGTIEQHFTTAIVRSAQTHHLQAVRSARSVIGMVEAAPPSGFHWVEFCSGAVEAMVAALLAPDDVAGLDRVNLRGEIGRAIDLLEGFSTTFPHVGPRVPLARGLLAVSQTRRADAAELLVQAHDQAVLGGYEYDAARCVVLCRMFGVDALHHALAPVRATMARLGATRWVERIDALPESV